MNKAGKIVLGTVQFGCQYGINSAGRPSPEAVKAILGEAAAGGIATLDTSCAYGDAEQVLGSTGKAADFRVVSKFLRTQGASVADTFSRSLARLGVSRLYGYLIHHFSDWVEDPALWDALQELREQGATKRIGFSLYTPDELETVLKKGMDFDLLQIPHNIFDRKFDPYLPELAARGVEIHVRSTFLQGLFFKDRDSLSETMKPLRRYLLQLDEAARATGLSVAELALNYNLQNPFISGVLIGVDNVAQLQTNINSVSDVPVDIDISVKEQDLLNPVNWK